MYAVSGSGVLYLCMGSRCPGPPESGPCTPAFRPGGGDDDVWVLSRPPRVARGTLGQPLAPKSTTGEVLFGIGGNGCVAVKALFGKRTQIDFCGMGLKDTESTPAWGPLPQGCPTFVVGAQ